MQEATVRENNVFVSGPAHQREALMRKQRKASLVSQDARAPSFWIRNNTTSESQSAKKERKGLLVPVREATGGRGTGQCREDPSHRHSTGRERVIAKHKEVANRHWMTGSQVCS